MVSPSIVPLIVAAALLGQGLHACARSARGSEKARAVARSPNTEFAARWQGIANDEARRVHAEWGAKRVAILVMDPHRGEVLALSDDEPGAPIVPASTLKTLTVALALDAEAITPQQPFDCGGGTRAYGRLQLRDAGQYAELDAGHILQVSSNIGVSRIFDALGADRFRDGLRLFHVATPSDIESGSLRSAIIANGEGSTLTPLALTAAYGVFANDGVLAVAGAPPARVIKKSTARAVRSMLEGVVAGELGTGRAAAVSGVRVGGKTGTSDPNPDCQVCPHDRGPFANFVGIVPIDAPRWVIYVGVERPKKDGTGGTIAAPAFARMVMRALLP